MVKGLPIYPMRSMSEDNILNQSKQVDKINIFGSCYRVIFDTVETDSCTPNKRKLIDIKMEINANKLNLISK